ncbi:hypothetical protein THIX_30269 [Thiomonas sp. X19]|nr:hypothetical protein THIX_30269 [Thiomonas sp. X19]
MWPGRSAKRVFLDRMNQVVPWAALVALIEPSGPAPWTLCGRRLRSRSCCVFTFYRKGSP